MRISILFGLATLLLGCVDYQGLRGQGDGGVDLSTGNDTSPPLDLPDIAADSSGPVDDGGDSGTGRAATDGSAGGGGQTDTGGMAGSGGSTGTGGGTGTGGMAGTGGGGSGGTGGGPACSPPTAVAIFDATPAGTAGLSCNQANAMAADGAWAGLDALTAGATLIDGVFVTACIAADFGSVVNLDPVVVRARSIGNACGGACAVGLCNTGDDMLVYFGTTRGSYQFAKSIPIVPTFNDYPITLGVAARYVLVCRNGSGAGRDDVAVDAIHSAATCP